MINYSLCQKGEQPHFEPQTHFCFSKECTHQGLLCNICVFQHPPHVVKHLRTIQKQLRDQKPPSKERVADILLKVQRTHSQFLRSISQIRMAFNEKLQNLQKGYMSQFSRFKYQIQKHLSPDSPLDSFLAGNSSCDRGLLQFLTSLKSSAVIGEDLKVRSVNLQEFVQKWYQSVNTQNFLLKQSFKKIGNQIQQTAKRIKNLNFQQTSFKFQFSKTLKGLKINIKENGLLAQQSSQESTGQRFCVAQPAIISIKRRVVFIFQIVKCASWVGVGICLKKKMMGINYAFLYSNLGHGSYLISNNGYCWSHSVKQQNSVQKSFKFQDNDRIFVELDMDALKIRFRKNKGPQRFEMDIQKIQDDEYHPCANLCNNGDSVRILEDAKQNPI